MDQSLIEIVVLALIAGFVLIKLYTTLGRRSADEPTEPRPQPVQGAPLSQEAMRSSLAPPLAGAALGGDGVMAIVRADPAFDTAQFLMGARGAYELIVGAFARGDRDALKPLLTPRVFEAYSNAIAQREATGGAGPEIVRLRHAELAEAGLQGSVARVTVKFEAELAEGAHGVRDAREKWTFERDVRSSDPNWRLARVAAA